MIVLQAGSLDIMGKFENDVQSFTLNTVCIPVVLTVAVDLTFNIVRYALCIWFEHPSMINLTKKDVTDEKCYSDNDIQSPTTLQNE